MTASIWTLYYTFTLPVAPRVFTVLQVLHFDDVSPRQGSASSSSQAHVF